MTDLGWDARWAEVFALHETDGLVPARVAIEFNHIYRLAAATGDVQAEHAGRLRHQAAGRDELAAVGDWVAVRLSGDGRHGTIERVLPRRSRFVRKEAGELTRPQVVAANIDIVFVVMGLDRDFNPRRLERYLLLAAESGATAVVLLTKADLVDDGPERAREVEALAPSTPVHVVSAPEGLGLDPVMSHLGRGRTGALLGSSGVGKSTLINALTGSSALRTAPVRAADSRGRHTTRHRQLIVLPGRGVLIDTPGMRELQIWDVAAAVDDTFSDIDVLAEGCHFTNCRHIGEPRCAVVNAVDEGRLTPDRLAGYLKLQAEIRAAGERRDVRARIDDRRQGRAPSRMPGRDSRDRRR